jgi:cystathionine gamma-lyase
VEIVKTYNENIKIIINNTFLTSYNQKPLKYSVDIFIHSITKYLNGHSDVIMGCLICNNSSLYHKLKFIQNTMGILLYSLFLLFFSNQQLHDKELYHHHSIVI